jgi:hypothetical protein
MFGKHWMRLVCDSLADRFDRRSWDHASRPRARPFKHRALRLEMCEDRSLLSGGGMMIGTTQCPTTDHADQSSDASVEQLASSDSSNGPTGSNAGASSEASGISHAVTFVASDAPLVTALVAGTPAQNLAFVQRLYKDVLGRTGDSAGINAWFLQVNNGMTTSTVAGIFWESVEHRGIQVDSYYATYFHRASDPAGRQVWINAMTSGMSEEAVIDTFVTSDEYKNANPLNNSFVVGLYRDVLGRSADSAGLTAWAAVLSGGSQTPAQVAQAFIDSHERHVRLVDLYYTHLLGRAADTAGETFWAGQLDTAAADDQGVAEAFLSSPEYFTKLG